MNRINFLLGCFFLLYACSMDSNDAKSSKRMIYDIDDVKSQLCFSEGGDCPDSIHVVRLKNSNLYIFQDFGDVLNRIRLIRLEPNTFVILDSIQTFQDDDFFKQVKIHYDYKNDWFVYFDSGSGTGDLSKHEIIVRVENNHFSSLFSYTKNMSVIDVESDHDKLPYVQIEQTELVMNKKRIILKTDFESGIIDFKKGKEQMTDTVLFEFSSPLNVFVWKSSTNSKMKERWWREKGEYIFRP